jgi:parallel beta-helix repeat protein
MRDILIIFILLIGFADAEEIVVAPQNADYSAIQSALDNSSMGDVIKVESGTYYENIIVKTSVSLLGRDTGKGLPVIDANRQGSAITLYSDRVLLQGFNLTNSGHCGCGNSGIKIESNNNTIAENNIYKNKYGIHISRGTGNKIFGNDLDENEINAYDSQNNSWMVDIVPRDLFVLLGKVAADPSFTGNHYSDYDNPSEGCIDSNSDGFCDSPKNISGGSNKDYYPLISN